MKFVQIFFDEMKKLGQEICNQLQAITEKLDRLIGKSSEPPKTDVQHFEPRQSDHDNSNMFQGSRKELISTTEDQINPVHNTIVKEVKDPAEVDECHSFETRFE